MTLGPNWLGTEVSVSQSNPDTEFRYHLLATLFQCSVRGANILQRVATRSVESLPSFTVCCPHPHKFTLEKICDARPIAS